MSASRESPKTRSCSFAREIAAFALPAGIVAELAPPVRLHVFPHTSTLVSGVIVRRGRIVPVYEAGPRARRQEASPRSGFILIARCSRRTRSELSAIPVNGECELATGKCSRRPWNARPYVAGTLAIGDESVDVLNLDALIAT